MSVQTGGAPQAIDPTGPRAPITFLHPGQMLVSAAPIRLTTIVGSCVSVCLWDSVGRIGGVNHFLLPFGGGVGPATLRFGNVAIARLIESLMGLGAAHANLVAKVFGGACVIDAFLGRGEHLGLRNAQAAADALAREGVPIVASDTGGRRGRKIIFDTASGTVWVREI
jgi:chemotaxis protein CheD